MNMIIKNLLKADQRQVTSRLFNIIQTSEMYQILVPNQIFRFSANSLNIRQLTQIR